MAAAKSNSVLCSIAGVAVAMLICGSTVHAALTTLSPELIQKVRAMAETTRTAHPASPTDAGSTFLATFNGEFGDITPVDLRVVETPELRVHIVTPIMMLRNVMMAALQSLSPLPTLDELKSLRTVIVSIQPQQRGARDISRVVLFRGDKQLEPVTSSLAPQTFTNEFGAEFTINAGSIAFSEEAWLPGSDLKLVLLSGASPIEWKLSAADVARIR